MLRLLILGTITILMMKALYGSTMDASVTPSPDASIVTAGSNAGLDSSYMLPEMIITAPRIVHGNEYSYERYQYGRTYFQAAVRRLVRIAGYMIMVTMSVAWIVLILFRIPHSHRIRNKKKHLSYVYMARTRHEPWTMGKKP